MAGGYFNLAHARTFRSLTDPHVAAIESLNANRQELPEKQRAYIAFAAAKVFDDLGLHDKAFPLWIEDNALVRARLDYDQAKEIESYRRLEQVFTSEFVARHRTSGIASALPIFIVGMPRSGTTLIEQIIASHTAVTAGGELHDFGRAVNAVAEDFQKTHRRADFRYPDFLADFEPRDFAAIGNAYVAGLSARWLGSQRITDKMPANYLHAGIIHLALPNARIIHARRNPVDVCVSCFSKFFAGAVNFSYDLKELGIAYSEYEKTMAHWRRVLPPGTILDVDYESVISNTEAEIRRILNFCGLDWDDRVLEYYKTERSVRTASATQVRQPIYRTSVERWRNYEAYLGPLLEALGPSSPTAASSA